MFVSSMIYPLAIYELTSSFSAKLALTSPASAQALEEKRNAILFVLTLWQIGFTAVVFIISIFFSHKIAGPLYKIGLFLDLVKEGRGRGILKLRKGDYFHELANEFNQTFESINENYRKDFQYLEEVTIYINSLEETLPEKEKVAIQEINKRLAAIQQRFDVI